MISGSTVLPPIVQKHSPNFSSRHGTKIDLLVWHESAGHYDGDVSWLCNPALQASAMGVLREDGGEFTQLVKIADKAWHAAAFNPRSIGIEHSNIFSKGYASEAQLQVSARIFGWLCINYNIPPRWSRDGHISGICRHQDLGSLGSGHTQCGIGDLTIWHKYLEMVGEEVARGDYKKVWAL